MKCRGYLSGLRTHGIKPFLWEISTKLGLDFKVLDREKGWFRETVYFEFSGDEKNLKEAEKIIKDIVKTFE